jgi:hypothetical protein
VIAIALFLIELEIFAVAVMKSGKDYKLQILDKNGNLVHETDGKTLSDFNKYYFEKTFGPFEQYDTKLVTKDIPFPFRAWFVAAVGIPMGAILLFAFVVKAYLSLFYGEYEDEEEEALRAKTEPLTGFEKFIASITGFNIFVIGFIVFLAIILYWIIPETITYLFSRGEATIIRYMKIGEDIIVKYEWFFLSVIIAFFGFIAWIVYLRYLLAKKTIESQTEIDKHRLQLEYSRNIGSSLQLEYDGAKAGTKPLITWNDDGDGDTAGNKGSSPKRK